MMTQNPVQNPRRMPAEGKKRKKAKAKRQRPQPATTQKEGEVEGPPPMTSRRLAKGEPGPGHRASQRWSGDTKEGGRPEGEIKKVEVDVSRKVECQT